MIALLALRTLGDRPRRTAFLLFGFGISVGVMIVLLSIGEAVLEQARDKDLVGGGDLVLLPDGIDVEVLKVGGATGMYFAIDNASFVYRQVLSGPRFAPHLAAVPAPEWPGEPPAPPLAAASPMLVNKVVYLRRKGDTEPPRRAQASGVIPSLDRTVRGGNAPDWADGIADRSWMDPPVDSLYNALDRFHEPNPNLPHLDRWGEWLYFNFTQPGTGVHAFLSFIVGGDLTRDEARALPLLQIVHPGRAPRRFQGDLPLRRQDVAFDRVDLRFGTATRVTFRGGEYHLQLGWQSPEGEVQGELHVRPARDVDFPPFLIHSSDRFVSGYTVPAVHATLRGWIEAGGERLDLEGAPAYHDHNWGTWRDVHWDWGTASNGDQALFYGRVRHPELRPGTWSEGVFMLVTQARRPGVRGGFLGLFRPDSIVYTWEPARDVPGGPLRTPRSFEIRADSVRVGFEIESVVATPPRQDEDALVFLQLEGRFEVELGAGRGFAGPGFAETFVPQKDHGRPEGRP